MELYIKLVLCPINSVKLLIIKDLWKFLEIIHFTGEFKRGEAPKAKNGVFISRRLIFRVGGRNKEKQIVLELLDKAITMRFLTFLVILSCYSATSTSSINTEARELTPGIIKKEIRIGLSQAEI